MATYEYKDGNQQLIANHMEDVENVSFREAMIKFHASSITPALILAIIFGLLIASIVYLYLCRCEIKRKISLLEKHYGQLKNRYNALLCETELDNVFEDCNPNKNGSHSSVLKSQMNLITWCWVVIVFVMFVAMDIVAYMNICH